MPVTGISVHVFARTDVGRTREHNEDAFTVADLSRDLVSLKPEVQQHVLGVKGTLFMVADGMGGAAAGEVASALATETVVDELRDRWIRADTHDPEAFASAVRDAVAAANARIHRYAAEHPEHRGMGSTCTVAGLLGDRLFLAQVGDSRAYLIRGGVAIQLTKDQSLVQKLVEAGELTAEEAELSERRNIILQALGPEPRVKVDLTTQQVRRGDTLVLCSDGLSGQVRAEAIASVVAAERDLAAVCKQLIDRANAAGGPDNITVVAARFEGEALAEPSADESVGHQTFRFSGQRRETVVDPEAPTPPLGVSAVTAPVEARVTRRIDAPDEGAPAGLRPTVDLGGGPLASPAPGRTALWVAGVVVLAVLGLLVFRR